MTTPYTSLLVGGIQTQVYGLDHLTPSNPHGLAVLFFLHGRFGAAGEDRFVEWSQAFIDRSVEQRKEAGGHGKDLLVVTLDQRNHGERLVDIKQNKGWKDGKDGDGLDNPSHAVDMLAVQTGTARDVSFLIDFLEPTLWPHDEHKVTDWFCGGVSLGGHATWLALAHEPRITLGIPIIGSPDVLTLLSHRATNLSAPHGPLPISAPYFPASYLRVVQRDDPVNVSRSVWGGRKICVLSGGADELVNYVHGGTERFVDEVLKQAVGTEGTLDVWLQDGCGHRYSKEMAERAQRFLWEHGLRVSGTEKSSARM